MAATMCVHTTTTCINHGGHGGAGTASRTRARRRIGGAWPGCVRGGCVTRHVHGSRACEAQVAQKGGHAAVEVLVTLLRLAVGWCGEKPGALRFVTACTREFTSEVRETPS